MLFVDKIFLFYFLPIFLLCFSLAPGRSKLGVLGLFSLVFYGWWNWYYLFLIGFSVLVDYYLGLAIHRAEVQSTRLKILWASVAINLTVLGFFKYFLFFNESLAAVASVFGLSYPPALLAVKMILPVGISFYTFQSMSYIIDIYRRELEPSPSLFEFFSCVIMFPHLVAGPIVRFAELGPQLRHQIFTSERLYLGAQFFIVGFTKKLIIADPVSRIANLAFDAQALEGFSRGDLTLGIVAYAVQIYFDFSGYSDMAVGLAYFCGFQFPQNFNSPYKATSVTDFWRRWHISLSSWLRDYVYISLGGNRCGRLRTYINLSLTMLIGGLWHGGSWTFVIWGAINGGLLAIEKLSKDFRFQVVPPEWLGRALTFSVVCLAWVFFRARDLPFAMSYLQRFFHNGQLQLMQMAKISHLEVLTLVCGLAIAFFGPNTWQLAKEAKPVRTLALASLFTVAVSYMMGTASHPFLYFQF